MKKLYQIMFLFLGLYLNAQIISFPDVNFKAKIIENGVDTNNDGEIQQSEALATLGLYLDSANINSLEGLEYFSNLTLLRCSDNPLTEINLCGTQVFSLHCFNNINLTSINLKNNIKSETLYSEPPLPPFFVGNLPSLQSICCDASELAEVQNGFNQFSPIIDTNCVNSCALLSLPLLTDSSMFTVFPNPTDTIINFNIEKNIQVKNVMIFNTLGQIIKSEKTFQPSINVSSLKTGTYLITIETPNGKFTKKFLKL